jgi:hypothetical protein
METPRSSGATSDHLQPPPSPYPATVDPSPVDSNGTNGTEVHSSRSRQWTRLTPRQIEDDAQINQFTEDELSDTRSLGPDDIVSPASMDDRAKVGEQNLVSALATSNSAQLSRLDTAVPARMRTDSDDGPQSVIHAPANFKTFVSVALIAVAPHSR